MWKFAVMEILSTMKSGEMRDELCKEIILSAWTKSGKF